MNFINKKLSIKFKEFGVVGGSHFYYVNDGNRNRLCSKTYKDNYVVVEGPKTSKILRNYNIEYISPAFSLSEINNLLKFYYKYFNVYYDIHNNVWKINEKIFKIFFLNYSKRKYLPLYKKMINKIYKNEVDLKGEILLFLIKSEFIDKEDIKN